MKGELQTLLATETIIPATLQGLQPKGPYIESLAGVRIPEDRED